MSVVTREQFCALPSALALGLVYDLARAKLEPMEPPVVVRPPKYDDRFPRKKGFYCWVSELSLDSLTWWRGKKAEGAEAGNEWSEKDAKWVAKLDKWIEWRRLFPYETWSGTRGEDRATAEPPSKDPKLHAWGPRNGPTNAPNTSSAPSADDDGRGADDDFSV